MHKLESRVLALEGGPRRGCLVCELESLRRGAEGLPALARPKNCGHPPTTLARELASLPTQTHGSDDDDSQH